MKSKINKSFIIVCIAILLVSALIFSLIISTHYVGELKQQIKVEATGLSALYEEKGIEDMSVISKQSSSRITIIAADGVVLYDDVENAQLMENHGDRYEFVHAKAFGNAETTRLSDTLSKNSYYYAVALEDGNVFRISKSTANLFGVLWLATPWVILSLVVVLIVVAILSERITKGIVKPINNIDLDNPLENETYSELTPLLRRINGQNEKIQIQIQEIRESQQDKSNLIANMQEGIMIVEKDSKISLMNEKAKTMLGGNEGDMYQSIFKETSEINAVENAFKGENTVFDYQVEDNCYEVRLSGSGNNSVEKVVAIIIDETAKTKAEKQRREFSSNVSHELKTPLTSIMGYSELIKNGLVLDKDVTSFGEKIHKEAKRLFALVSDILTISRLEESNEELLKQDVEAYEVLSSVVESLSEKAKEKDVEILLDKGSIKINTNKDKLFQILYNVIDNGINYNKVGGKVCISLENSTVVIKDTGIGIAEKDLQHITERFYRVDKSRSRDTGGTGLGLAIVKHEVASLKGSLEITSKVGVGTTVTITF